MKVEKTFRQGDDSFLVEVSLRIDLFASNDCCWKVTCHRRGKRSRTWIPVPNSEVPEEWLTETKNQLLVQIDATFRY